VIKMENKRIIYPTNEGGVVVIIPAVECGLTIEEIAAKDVPEGVSFKIVDVSEIPEDRTFRNAWEYDYSDDTVEETPVEDVPVEDAPEEE
jgi:hypothetical protein